MAALLLRQAAAPAALVLALALSGCGGLFLWPERAMVRDPSAAVLAFEDVRIPSTGGVMLHGWYLRAAAQPVRGTILFVHGNGGNISTHLGFVHWLPAAGYNVLLWDYRGYGLSGGEEDLAASHDDAAAVLAWLVARGGDDASRLVVYGQSLGASVALHAVTRTPAGAKAKGLVMESAFFGYRDIARAKLAGAWLTWPLQYPLSWLVPDAYSAARSIAAVAPRPLLLVHGRDDDIVPVGDAFRLYAKALEPRELWVVEGANHVNSLAKPADRARLLDWLEHILHLTP